jgi:hypothetical protein
MRRREEAPEDLSDPSYTPNRLLDRTAEMLHIETDARLALVLECDASLICHIRARRYAISAWLMVQIMDRTGWHITYVRELAGLPYDGVAKLVMVAQRIGMRFPRMWTAESKTSVDIRRSA